MYGYFSALIDFLSITLTYDNILSYLHFFFTADTSVFVGL